MPTLAQSRVVATLGGPGTFAGQATQAFVRWMPELGPVQYLATAAEVLDGDGRTAVVGTLLSAETNGLAVLERDIDRGSLGAWWIMSCELRVSRRPDVLVVGVSSAVEGALGDLLGKMHGFG